MVHEDCDVARNDDWRWTINGSTPATEVLDYLNEVNEYEFLNQKCPYCEMTLDLGRFQAWAEENNGDNLTYEVTSCRRCAFWEAQGYENTDQCMDPSLGMLAVSVARKFNEKVPEGCRTEIAQYLRRHPHRWNEMDPTALEKLVAEIFRANYAGCEVMHVGKPGDLGVDVVFVDHNGESWLIQVKRRTRNNRAEGFATLQSLLGTLCLEGKCRGIVVTTADYFSTQLRKQARRAEQRGFRIDLIDRGKLNRMLSPMLPDRPWRKVFRDGFLRGVNQSVIDCLCKTVPSAAEQYLFDI